jgi:hypothetical protein
VRLNKRGRRLRALLLLAALVAFIWWMSAGLWWTGDGWCAGTMAQCITI